MIDVQTILERNQLPASSVYLLELIPLIEVIWADGKNQIQEINILNDFTVKHLSSLSKDADGLEVVSVEEANQFIDNFLQQRPSQRLIDDLKLLSIERIKQRGDQQKISSVIDCCMDIAAACVSAYPYQPSERVREEEKLLIREIIISLELTDCILD